MSVMTKACLVVHDVDKMAIGVDYQGDGKPYWWCDKCEHMIKDKGLPFWHKYSPVWKKHYVPRTKP